MNKKHGSKDVPGLYELKSKVGIRIAVSAHGALPEDVRESAIIVGISRVKDDQEDMLNTARHRHERLKDRSAQAEAEARKAGKDLTEEKTREEVKNNFSRSWF